VGTPCTTTPELGNHVLPCCFARVSVRDELLEVVANLRPDLAIVDGEHHQQTVVLATLADASAAVLEHLHGELADVGVRLERGHGRDDDHIAAGLLQGTDQGIHLTPAVGVNDIGEIVDRSGQLRNVLLRTDCCWCPQQRDGEEHREADTPEARAGWPRWVITSAAATGRI
jgi:hypothetical protein